jgi:hypothetical protein
MFRSYDHHQVEKYIATLGLLNWQRIRCFIISYIIVVAYIMLCIVLILRFDTPQIKYDSSLSQIICHRIYLEERINLRGPSSLEMTWRRMRMVIWLYIRTTFYVNIRKNHSSGLLNVHNMGRSLCRLVRCRGACEKVSSADTVGSLGNLKANHSVIAWSSESVLRHLVLQKRLSLLLRFFDSFMSYFSPFLISVSDFASDRRSRRAVTMQGTDALVKVFVSGAESSLSLRETSATESYPYKTEAVH